MKDKENKEKRRALNINIRYNIFLIFTYLIGIWLLVGLFRIQIIKGLEYRENSNARLTNESKIIAKRGSILDRTGKPLATTNVKYRVEIYKTKTDNHSLNQIAEVLTKTLNENKEKYNNSYIINIKPFQFTKSNEQVLEWKEKRGINEKASAEEAFYTLRDKYEIQEKNLEKINDIICIRELIKNQGYNETGSIEIAKKVDRKTALELLASSDKIPGLNIVANPERAYEVNTLASHVLGYMGRINEEEYKEKKKYGYSQDENIGKTGIEGALEHFLKGKDGKKYIEMTFDGNVLDEYVTKQAVGGDDVILTIDSSMQKITERALEKRILNLRRKGYEINGGSAVVLDIKTGEVLSMASYPDFSPKDFLGGISKNDWEKYNNKTNPLINRAIQGSYEPGSSYKMVTGIAALNENKVKTDEYIFSTGIYPRAHKPRCWIYRYTGHGHGWMNIESALANSCNYYFYEMGYRLGIDKLEEYTRYFGLGEKTGIELTGEISGYVAGKQTAKLRNEKWTEGGTYSAAIGQSYNSFTPLQMAKYVAMIANDGRQVNPTIIKAVISSTGTAEDRDKVEKEITKEIGTNKNIKKSKKFKKEHIQAIKKGMKQVTSGNGTAARLFKDLPIKIAGKTGTAEAGNYVNGTFVCFAPYDDPKIAISVIIENGQSGGEAALVAKEIIQEYLGMNVVNIKEDMSVETESQKFI